MYVGCDFKSFQFQIIFGPIQASNDAMLFKSQKRKRLNGGGNKEKKMVRTRERKTVGVSFWERLIKKEQARQSWVSHANIVYINSRIAFVMRNMIA